MLVAMAVLFVPVIVVTQMFTRNPEPPVTAIDWRPVAEHAATEASYPVLGPANLPADWVATRARFTEAGRPIAAGDPAPGDTFQLGFLTGQQRYIALDQRDVGQESFVIATTRTGRADGTSVLAGQTWERMVSEDGRTRSLVLQSEPSVSIVSGDLPYEALEAFATTLEPITG